MSVTTGSLGTADVPASNTSLHGLDRVNFFLAAMLAGFGPYVAAQVTDTLLTRHIGTDHCAADHCRPDGSLGRATGTGLGPAPASAYRVCGFADARAGFRAH